MEFNQLSAMGSPFNCAPSVGSHDFQYKTIGTWRQNIYAFGHCFTCAVDPICATRLGRTGLHYRFSWLLAAVHCTRSTFENGKLGSLARRSAYQFAMLDSAMLISWSGGWPSTGKCCRHSFLSTMTSLRMKCHWTRYDA
jgi:hypothetical protein